MGHGFFNQSPHGYLIESPHGFYTGSVLAPGIARLNVTARDPSDGSYYIAIVNHDTFAINTTDTGPTFSPTFSVHYWSFGYGQEPSPGSSIVEGSRYLSWLGGTISSSGQWVARNGTTNIREYTATYSGSNRRGFAMVGANDFSANDAFVFHQVTGGGLTKRSVILPTAESSAISGYTLGFDFDDYAIEVDSSFDPVNVYARLATALYRLDGASGIDWIFSPPGTGSKTLECIEKNPTSGIFYVGYNYVTAAQHKLLQIDASTGVGTVITQYDNPAPPTTRPITRSIARVKDKLYVLLSQRTQDTTTSGDGLYHYRLWLERYDHASPDVPEELEIVPDYGSEFSTDPFNQTLIAEGHSLEQ